MSRFPKLTETFVLDEILELERGGVHVEVFPLWREPARVVHPEARPVVERAHFTPTLDRRILRDNLRCLRRAPLLYLGTLATLLRANAGSARFLLGALAIFPKACSFAERMHALGVQHVHAHFASHPAAAAFVIGRLRGLPWSFTAHGSDLHREQSMLREKVREARFVVAISEYNRRFILDRVGPEAADKIRMIHCGIDLGRTVARDTRPPARGELRIACVGTLHAVKGQAVLIDACARLRNRGVRFECHLIGDGPDREALEQQAERRGIADRIVFHGACERERVMELLGRMDVAAAPSVPTRDGRREGIPVVLMEAAACGLPAVASRLSGIPELVHDEETGLLVEPGDVDGVAVALERLARDADTRRRFGRNARKRVAAAFDLGANVSALREAIFRKEAT
jgi:glycosyltransferase involved in cell wall biosynthesis